MQLELNEKLRDYIDAKRGNKSRAGYIKQLLTLFMQQDASYTTGDENATMDLCKNKLNN